MIPLNPALSTAISIPIGPIAALIGLAVVLGCVPAGPATPRPEGAANPGDYARDRASMVDRQLRARDITDPRVLDAMSRVPRHEFVPEGLRDQAHADRPLPIGQGQTISQPYIVALMTQLAGPGPGDRALDVGTGSGYQAAVLAELAGEVFSIEIHEELADSARERLGRLGYDNVAVRHGDGYRGWPEHAPFDLIVVAAAPAEVPPLLVEQLAPGGRLVMPVGDELGQQLILIEKDEGGSTTRRSIAPVAFVPMTGEARGAGGPDR
ncbi:protein-L-isoaspartate(D-aspartate) O-methyltransferase [Tautonia plasticadhaerens]|uniref:Protein-L-isoaspartate O-methyltransferase n=1 Tax=Tautonia plasticadhaerens TaxID=2527974 RepID=A0A518HD69_9BACT|nr:protein-L-isoaspartate(D-aspartate) O-methyltransferase [Tautonia plasticadhaerens]QDV38780.1 Protein-L-isoaspartate O-methyltransferase [Tautonia plasticadhaerens]